MRNIWQKIVKTWCYVTFALVFVDLEAEDRKKV